MNDFLQQGPEPSVVPEATLPAKNQGYSGLLVGARFWYFADVITDASIALRRARHRAQKAIDVAVLLFGLSAFGFFVPVTILNHGVDALTLDVWLEPSFAQFALWLAILSACFLWFRVMQRKTDKKRVPDVPSKDVEQITTVPTLDVVERKGNIADVLLPTALNALEEAFRLAKKGGHANVTPIHIFLGTVGTHGVQMLFIRLGLTFDQMKDAIRRKLASEPKGEAVFGYEARTVVAQAFQNAVVHHRPKVSSIELFVETYKGNDFLKELLFSLNVEEEEFMNAVSWIRINEQLADRYQEYRRLAARKPKKNMDRAYTATETKFLDRVSEDLTRAGVMGRLPMLINREEELTSLLRSIEGGRQSVVLVGAPGVGKKAIVAGLAERMVEEKVPKILQDKRLVKLSVPHIVSAQGGSGAQERMLVALQEVGASGNIVLVIDGIDQLVGGEGVDLSSVLASELDKGYTFVIGTTTPQGYARLEASPLGNKLQKIDVEEPDRNNAIQVLESKLGAIESKNKVIFTYEAVAALVDLSMRYLHESFLPQKAIVLAQEVALEHSRSGKDWGRITKEHVAALISQKSKVPVTEVGQEESQKLLNLEERMHERVIGQEEAVKAVASALRRARVALRNEDKPIANFLFLGPTGVGKTELAKTTAEVYFGNESAMLRFDMSEYQDKPSIVRLIGGNNEGGLLTEAVRKNPFSLLLLDELEKAHPDILNLFLQVMDDGRLTDGTGRTVDFTNVIIIATSNAGTQYIQEQVSQGADVNTIREHLLEEELKQTYRPEFLNRFDGVMVFKPLSEEDVIAIAYLMMQKVAKRLEAKGMNFQASDEAIHELAKKGYDPKFGARPLRRVIQEEVDNAVAEFLLKGKVSRRDTLLLQPGGVIEVQKAEVL